MHCNFWKLSIGLYLMLSLYVASVHAVSGPVGSVDGSFSVTPGGTASYTIPIKVPAGIGGIKPSISLSYNSQAGNGLLGVGWNLSGLSTITRCPQNLAQDGQIRDVKFDTDDRFCLDGQRLVAISGVYGEDNTEYRTEQDSFVKVISKGFRDHGPESFEVLTKDGLRMEFGGVGGTNNHQYHSRFAAHGVDEEAVRLWAISRISDNADNVIDFSYQFVGNEDTETDTVSTTGYNREYYPSKITYSGGGELNFTYGDGGEETRPDPIMGYSGGGKIQTLKRLKKIAVSIGSTALVREYSLAYKPVDDLNQIRFDSNQSHLNTVTECGADGQCLPATQITWQSDQNRKNIKWVNANDLRLPADVVLAHSDGENRGVRFVDLDGDGVKDIVYHRHLSVSPEDSDNNNGVIQDIIEIAEELSLEVEPEPEPTAEQGAYLFKNNTWQPAPGFFPPYPLIREDGTAAGTEIIDINGDGLVDFVYARQESKSKFKSVAYLNDGAGWVKDNSARFKLKYPLGRFDNGFLTGRFVDLNGDGLTDIVHHGKETHTTWTYVDGGHTSSPHWIAGQVVDEGFSMQSNASLGTPTGWSDNQPEHIPPILLNPVQEYVRLRYTSYRGSGFPTSTTHPYYSLNAVRAPSSRVTLFVDINGDGLDDLLLYDKNTSSVYLKTTTGWEQSPNADYKLPINFSDVAYGSRDSEGFSALFGESGYDFFDNGASGARFVDVNGDGLVDIVQNRYLIPDVVEYAGSDFLGWPEENAKRTAAAAAASHKRVYLNTGNGWIQNDDYIPPQPIFIKKVGGTIKHVAQLYQDLNADGLVDLLFQRWDDETQGAYLNTGSGWQRNDNYYRPGYDLIRSNGKDAGTRFIDLNGDGKLNIVRNYRTPTVLKNSALISGIESHLINGITTGLGVTTAIRYKPLTDATVYTKGTGCQGPVLCVISSALVVSEHDVSNGIGGIAQYRYRYADARFHRRGRGWLGFASGTTTDIQTQKITTTTYDNATYNATYDDFPFARLAKKATISYPGKLFGDKHVVISDTINHYSIKSVDEHSAYYSVYLQSSSVETKNLDDSPLKYISATTQVDDYGNVTELTSETKQSAADTIAAYRQITTNTYDNDPVNWYLGRLRTASITAYQGENAQTRNTALAYYPLGHASAGLLDWMEEEPDDPDLYLKTEYSYDEHGNNNAITVSGSPSASYPIATRTITTDYDYSDALFPVVTITAPVTGTVSQSETNIYDARWGKLIRKMDVDAQPTSWTYDAFGRPSTETSTDGNQTTLTSAWCDATDADCPTLAVYKITTTRSDGARSTTYQDMFSRGLRTQTLGLDGVVVQQDQAYDAAGRLWRNSRPYLAGATQQYWTTTTFDDLSRVKTRINPDDSIVSNEYHDLETLISTERSAGGEYTSLSVRQINNFADQIEWVFDAHNNGARYTYFPFGELETVTDPLGNVMMMEYDNRGRRTKMIDPGMGTWDYAHDALGNLRWQQDARGQETTLDYDLLNRLQTRVDEQNPADANSVKKTSEWHYFTAADTDSACRSIGKLKSSSDGNISKHYCYDQYGRNTLTTTHFEAASHDVVTDGEEVSYDVTTDYDEFSRVKSTTYPIQGATNQEAAVAFVKRNVYDAYGHLKSVHDGADTDPLWIAEQINASGDITTETLGNGLTTTRVYDPAMGYLSSINSGTQGGSGVQDLAFAFDSLGTLISRTDHNRIIARANGSPQNGSTESFTYDALNRVSTVLRDGQQTAQYQYDALGNITFNSELGTYLYNSTRPHAVTDIKRSNTGPLAGDISNDGRINALDAALLGRNLVGLSALNSPQMLAADCNAANGVNLDDSVCIAAHAGSTSSTIDEKLSYDANGNMLRGIAGKVVTYTAFNKPETISKGAYSTRFTYDTERSRYQQVATDANGTTTTHYVGQLFERIQQPDGLIEYKNYLYAGERMIAISTRRSDNSSDLNYLHQDHINSITAISDANGIVKARFSYDVFGKRRDDATWQAASEQESMMASASDSNITHRGYTEHEFLEGAGLIHMNGRVFDPELGRFLSADPYVQFEHNLQSFNRYSYVMNNPLSFNDPSGYYRNEENGGAGYHDLGWDPYSDYVWSTGYDSEYGIYDLGYDGYYSAGIDTGNSVQNIGSGGIDFGFGAGFDASGSDMGSRGDDIGVGGCSDGYYSMCHSATEIYTPPTWLTVGLGVAVGISPAGIYADGVSAWRGEDFITGESLSGWERAAILMPGVSEVRTGIKAAKSIGNTPKYTYRGDYTDHEKVFDRGFRAKGSSTDIVKHAIDSDNPPSAFVGTSKSRDVARGYNPSQIYVIRPRNGIDVNRELTLRKMPPRYEQEIAVQNRVLPGDVRAVTLPDRSILNPNYKP